MTNINLNDSLIPEALRLKFENHDQWKRSWAWNHQLSFYQKAMKRMQQLWTLKLVLLVIGSPLTPRTATPRISLYQRLKEKQSNNDF